MDALILFALLLVGGLIFSSNWNHTRWRLAREEGHRLYFQTVLHGSLLFVAAFAVRKALGHLALYNGAELWLKAQIAPLAKEQTLAAALSELAITCFVAMIISWPIAGLLNIALMKRYCLANAIREDELEGFLLDAADKFSPICITQSGGKVYVGYVVGGFDPSKTRKTLSMLPLVSGYRDKDTRRRSRFTRRIVKRVV